MFFRVEDTAPQDVLDVGEEYAEDVYLLVSDVLQSSPMGERWARSKGISWCNRVIHGSYVWPMEDHADLDAEIHAPVVRRPAESALSA